MLPSLIVPLGEPARRPTRAELLEIARRQRLTAREYMAERGLPLPSGEPDASAGGSQPADESQGNVVPAMAYPAVPRGHASRDPEWLLLDHVEAHAGNGRDVWKRRAV